MARNVQKDSFEDGSFPGGNGGRVNVPIHRNREGMDASVDPDFSIYSGMTKREARQSGKFCRMDNLPPDIPED